MSYDTQENIEYRFAEQRLVEEIIGELHHNTDEDYVGLFGWLAQGFTATLAGTRPINISIPLPMPLEPETAKQVIALWQLTMGKIHKFCDKPGDQVDEVQFRYILLRVHEKVFASVHNRVVSDRSRQSPNRT